MNELAESREVFPKTINERIFDNDNKLTLKSFFAFYSVLFFFNKDQRRKDGNDFEKATVPTIYGAGFSKYSSVTLKSYNLQHS